MPRPSYCCKYCEFNKGKYCSHNNTEVFDPWSLTNICEDFELVGNERYLDLTYYMRIVERFLDTGECEILPDVDVLEGYLRNAMNSPVIKVLALSSEVGGKIFETNIRKFLYRILELKKFHFQMKQTEEEKAEQYATWSAKKRSDAAQALVQNMTDQYEQYGFPGPFYVKKLGTGELVESDDLWKKMCLDSKDAIQQKYDEKLRKLIDEKAKHLPANLQRSTKQIEKELQTAKATTQEFSQAYEAMGGVWDKTDFLKKLKIVRLQQKYHQLEHIARKMGRTANDNSTEVMSLASGQTQAIEHASHSDIIGITVGHDLNSLLPSELAQFTDEETESLFIQRYITNSLQVFRYKSEIAKPARTLNPHRAKRNGPMIVCIDTSKSMIGPPMRISQSMLMRIIDLSRKEQRSCYVIAFSVSIRPIDISREHDKLVAFFQMQAVGNTDATQMLQATCNLLESSENYLNADVLWISDFCIPLVEQELIDRMQSYRTQGTRFYGLHIGEYTNRWKPYFDEITHIGYTPTRRY